MPKRKSGDAPDGKEPKRLRTRAQHKKKSEKKEKSKDKKDKAKEKSAEQSNAEGAEGISQSSEANQASGSGEASTSNATEPARPESPEPTCSICLSDTIENKSFTDSCFHTFCFVCLVEWSKVKAVCPLCKQPFKSIIHNVRTLDDYDRYDIPTEPPPEPRFRYRTTMVDQWASRRTETAPGLSRPTRTTASIAWNRRRQTSTSAFRRRVYTLDMRVQEITTPAGQPVRYREINPAWFRRYPASTHRLVPWLNRELNVLLNNNDNQVTFVLELILDLIKRFDIQSRDFSEHLSTFLGRRTDHFVHEFYMFARSPSDILNFDRHAVYFEPNDAPDLNQFQNTRLSSSSSGSARNNDEDDTDDDDVIFVPNENEAARRSNTSPSRSEPHDSRHNLRLSPMARRVQDFLHDYTSGVRPWESPTPGPSNFWSASPFFAPLTSLSSVPTFDDLTTLQSLVSGPSRTQTQTSTSTAPAAAAASRRSPSLSSHESDLEVVGEEKPWTERSPIPVLSSSSGPEIIGETETSTKQKKQKKHKKKKKKHSKWKHQGSGDRSTGSRERVRSESRSDRWRWWDRDSDRRRDDPSESSRSDRHRDHSQETDGHWRVSERHRSSRSRHRRRPSQSSDSSLSPYPFDGSSSSRSRSRPKKSSSHRQKRKQRQPRPTTLMSLLSPASEDDDDDTEVAEPMDLSLPQEDHRLTKTHTGEGGDGGSDGRRGERRDLEGERREGGDGRGKGEKRRDEDGDGKRRRDGDREGERRDKEGDERREGEGERRTDGEGEGERRRDGDGDGERGASEQHDVISLESVAVETMEAAKRPGRSQSQDDPHSRSRSRSKSKKKKKKRKKTSRGGTPPPERAGRYKKHKHKKHKKSSKESRSESKAESKAESKGESEIKLKGRESRGSSVEVIFKKSTKRKDRKPKGVGENEAVDVVDLLSSSDEERGNQERRNKEESAKQLWKKNATGHKKSSAKKTSSEEQASTSGQASSNTTSDAPSASSSTTTTNPSSNGLEILNIDTNIPSVEIDLASLEHAPKTTSKISPASVSSETSISSYHSDYSDKDDTRKKSNPMGRVYTGPVIDVDVATDLTIVTEGASGSQTNPVMVEMVEREDGDNSEPQEQQACASTSATNPPIRHLTVSSDDSDMDADEATINPSKYTLDKSYESTYNWKSSMREKWINSNDFEEPREMSPSPLPQQPQSQDNETDQTDQMDQAVIVDQSSQSKQSSIIDVCASVSKSPTQNDEDEVEIEDKDQSDIIDPDTKSFIEQLHAAMASTSAENVPESESNIEPDQQPEARQFHPVIENVQTCETSDIKEELNRTLNDITESRREDEERDVSRESEDHSPRSFDIDTMLKDFKPVIEDVTSCGASVDMSERQQSTGESSQTPTSSGNSQVVKEELKDFNPVIDNVHSVDQEVDMKEEPENIETEMNEKCSEGENTENRRQITQERDGLGDGPSSRSGPCQKSPELPNYKSELDAESFGILDVRSMDCDEFRQQSYTGPSGDYVKENVEQREQETEDCETTKSELDSDVQTAEESIENHDAENLQGMPETDNQIDTGSQMDTDDIDQLSCITTGSNEANLSVEVDRTSDSTDDNRTVTPNTNETGSVSNLIRSDIASFGEDNMEDKMDDTVPICSNCDSGPCSSSHEVKSTPVCDSIDVQHKDYSVGDMTSKDETEAGLNSGMDASVLEPVGNENNTEEKDGVSLSVNDSGCGGNNACYVESDISGSANEVNDCENRTQTTVSLDEVNSTAEMSKSVPEVNDCEAKTQTQNEVNDTAEMSEIVTEGASDLRAAKTETLVSANDANDVNDVTDEIVNPSCEMNDGENEIEDPGTTHETVAYEMCDSDTTTETAVDEKDNETVTETPINPETKHEKLLENGYESTVSESDIYSKDSNEINEMNTEIGIEENDNSEKDVSEHLSNKLRDLETPPILLPRSAFPSDVV